MDILETIKQINCPGNCEAVKEIMKYHLEQLLTLSRSERNTRGMGSNPLLYGARPVPPPPVSRG